MANEQAQILVTLRNIEQQLKSVSGASADYVANARKENGLGSSESEKKKKGSTSKGSEDKIASGNKGLIDSFARLRLETRKLAESQSKYNKHIQTFDKATNQLNALSASLDKDIKAGKESRKMYVKTRLVMESLSQQGVNVSKAFSNLTESSAPEDFTTALAKATIMVDNRRRAAERGHDSAMRRSRQRQKEMDDSVDNFNKNLKTAMKVLITGFGGISSEVSLAAQNASMSFAPQGQGTESGMFGGIVDSFLGMMEAQVGAIEFGASAQDIARFGAQNRSTLAAALDSAVLSLKDVTEGTFAKTGTALSAYGDSLEKEFGFVGTKQLENISRSFSILSNLGVQITPENLERLRQGVEDVASTSNMLADEVFAELTDIANDVDFQALTLAMNQGEDVIDMLTTSFTSLQKSVGLNMREFSDYTKFLAKQRTRTGSERMVQAGFVGQIARGLGYSAEQIALLQRGTMSREAIQREGRGVEFDELYNEMRRDLTNARMEAAGAGTGRGMAALENIDILRAGAGFDELFTEGRERSGEVDAVRKAQESQLAQSRAQTGSLQSLNATINSYMKGLAQSALGLPVVGFFKSMTGSVFTGTLMAGMAAKAMTVAAAAATAGLAGAAVGTLYSGIMNKQMSLYTNALGIEGVNGETGINSVGEAGFMLQKAIFGDPNESRMGELTRKIDDQREKEAIVMQRIKDADNESARAASQEQLDAMREIRDTLQKELDVMLEDRNKPERETVLGAKGSGGERATDARSGG